MCAPSWVLQCHFVIVYMLLNNNFALIQLEAGIYSPFCTFEGMLRFFILVLILLFVLLHLHLSTFPFIIPDEPRKTGFDNNDWPSMWVSSSQVLKDNFSSFFCSWLGNWHVASWTVPRNLIVLTRLVWGWGLQRPVVITTQG